jgi:hypothetical protein
MHNRDEYMNVYARVRATVLLKSLQQLKEQQRSSSGGSIQGIPAANSPMVVSFFIQGGTCLAQMPVTSRVFISYLDEILAVNLVDFLVPISKWCDSIS